MQSPSPDSHSCHRGRMDTLRLNIRADSARQALLNEYQLT